MRQGRVYYNDVLAGIITEDENGYSFVYDGAYLASNGFQKKLMRMDFMQAMEATGISNQVAERILNRFIGLPSKWFACIDDSFISDDQKARFKSLIQQRIDVLEKT